MSEAAFSWCNPTFRTNPDLLMVALAEPVHIAIPIR